MLSYQPFIFFFFNDTATTEIYTLSLHDALPISTTQEAAACGRRDTPTTPPRALQGTAQRVWAGTALAPTRSEEHTSELQSLAYLVCRLLLEKKKKSRQTRRANCTSCRMSRTHPD